MAEPYVKKDPGDIIRAQDWNDMQSRARDAIEGHTHAGAGQGPLLTGVAIDPTTALKVKSVAADTLSVAGADLSASLKALLDKVNAALPLAGGTVTGELVARGGLRLVDAEIRLRSDGNHGLGYYGSDKRFAGQAPDGPVLYGFSGGGLGSINGGQRLALTWDAQQHLYWGGNNAMLRSDQGGSLELGGNDGVRGSGSPYIDFHFKGLQQDYNVRLINDADGQLSVYGNLNVRGRVSSSLARAISVKTNKVETSSTAWVALPDMKTSFTSTGGPMLLMFKTGGVQATPAGNRRVRFRMLLDGKEQASCAHEFHNDGWELRDVNLMIFVSVGAGRHELSVDWYIDTGGTAACCWYNDQRVLMGIEL